MAPTGPLTAASSCGRAPRGDAHLFWAGEGLIDFQTRVSGRGRVVLNTTGTIDEIVLEGERLAVEGKQIIARTEGLHYSIRRPTRSLIGYWLSVRSGSE